MNLPHALHRKPIRMKNPTAQLPPHLRPIHRFLTTHRQHGRLLLNDPQRQELSALLQTHAFVTIDLNHSKPLSTMESLVLGLRLITQNYQERSLLLGIPKNTILKYEKRAKIKLGTDTILQALCVGIQNQSFGLS